MQFQALTRSRHIPAGHVTREHALSFSPQREGASPWRGDWALGSAGRCVQVRQPRPVCVFPPVARHQARGAEERRAFATGSPPAGSLPGCPRPRAAAPRGRPTGNGAQCPAGTGAPQAVAATCWAHLSPSTQGDKALPRAASFTVDLGLKQSLWGRRRTPHSGGQQQGGLGVAAVPSEQPLGWSGPAAAGADPKDLKPPFSSCTKSDV